VIQRILRTQLVAGKPECRVADNVDVGDPVHLIGGLFDRGVQFVHSVAQPGSLVGILLIERPGSCSRPT
jgi:hypothetical protein